MITNEWIVGSGDISVPLTLRQQVFTEEQHAQDSDRDDYDPQALHLVLYNDERPVAAGRLYHDGRSFRLGRCCVEKGSRGQGFGDLLVKLLLLKAFEYSPSQVRIHAQTQAAPFYRRYGFEAEGEPFAEAGIEHVAMRVDRDSLKIPSKCGEVRRFDDFFEPAPAEDAGN